MACLHQTQFWILCFYAESFIFFFSMYEGEKMLTEIVYFTGSIFFSLLMGIWLCIALPKPRFTGLWGLKNKKVTVPVLTN